MSDTVSLPDFASLPPQGIVGLRLQNAGDAVLSSGIATFGQVFQQGEVPAGGGLIATVAGKSAGIQMDVKSTYPDGSVKFAVLAVERPAIAAGAAVDVVLSHGSPATAAAINLTTALTGHDFTVDLVTAGGTKHVDVLQALSDALAAGTASVWQEGPLAAQARVEIALEGSQRLVFDVTAFKGGGFEVEAQFNNDRAMEAVGGRVAYTAVVTMDGREVAREVVDQGQYQNWHQGFSSNGRDGGQGLGDPKGGWLNIQHDTVHLEATGAISPYNFNQGISTAKLNEWSTAMDQAGWGDPLAANGVTKYMPMTGGRDDIGITTATNTGWILTQDARAAAFAMDQAEAAGGIPWNFWDAANGTWLNSSDYPRLWLDPRGGTGSPGDASSGGLTQQIASDVGWTLDTAHQPNLSYVPYLMTGERWILDNLNAQAAWTVLATYPGERLVGQDLFANGSQVRAAAWNLREVQGAAFANPDGSTEKAYFDAIVDKNWSWLVAQIPKWTEMQGEAHGWVPRDSTNPVALAPWQQDYFASVTILAARQGNADALTFLQWQSNYLIGRFTHEAEGFNPHDGAAYKVLVGDQTTGEFYKTWQEIGAATEQIGWSEGAAWSRSNYPQLALATLAGIYEVTGSVAAANAYWAVADTLPPFTSMEYFASDPTNAFVPPPRDGQVVTPPPGTGGLTGGGGADTLTGGTGGDTLSGLGGHDYIDGRAGDDSLLGGQGDDTLIGGAGHDTLDGGAGADSMVGGAGNDVYRVDAAGDVTVEAPGGGDDVVYATLSWALGANVEGLVLLGTGDFSGTGNGLDNRIEGNAGNNVLNGGAGNDTLIGGAGNDVLNGIPGVDSMVGGDGNDTYYVDDALDSVVEAAGGGTDRVIATTNYTLTANVENLTIGAGAAYSGTGNALANVITGNDLGNLISGLDGHDTLNGMGGADTLLGGAGNDQLNGGLGADSMVGGMGDDRYIVDNALDRVTEEPGGGTDRVVASIDYTLTANVEHLTLTAGATSGTGNTLANTIIGNAADNVLSGLGGNDVLAGMNGDDTLYGGAGNDRLQGNNGNDVLVGGDGNDILSGGAGADIFQFTAATAGWDRIADFTPGTDSIEILGSGFGDVLPLGVLADANFRAGGGAVGSVGQFLYNTTTGVLRWDQDGAGGAAPVVVAVLTGAPDLHASDISVIG